MILVMCYSGFRVSAFVQKDFEVNLEEGYFRGGIKTESGRNRTVPIHSAIRFEDIYEWAGMVRTIDMSKKGTRFTRASRIVELAERIFGRLNHMDNFVGLETEEFLNEITDFYCSTNMLHPFREGNGRTQRAFLQQLIRNAGYDLSFAAMDPDELMIATIQASNGVTDGLHRLLMENIRKG